MITLLRLLHKEFTRTKILAVISLGILAINIFCMAVLIKNFPLHQDVYYILQRISWYTLILYPMFLLIGYEFAVKIHTRKMRETLLSLYPSGAEKTIRDILLLLSGYALIYFAVNIALYIPIMLQISPPAPEYLWHVLRFYLLYFLLLPIAAAFAGTALACWLKHRRWIAYPLIILLILLNTSYLDPILYIPYNIEHGGNLGSYLTNALYGLRDYFSLSPFGSNGYYESDYLYGVPMELPRWLLMLAYCFISGLIILATTASFQRIKHRRLGGMVAVGALSIACLTGFHYRGSMLIMDERPNGAVLYDQLKYSARQQIDNPLYQQDAGFDITAISGDINIYNQLSANLEIALTPLEANIEQYAFTLYHKYNIARIEQNGKAIPYLREGDFFYIDKEYLEGSLTFNIKYSGYSAHFYSNMQAVFLPGYFPYYPMEGKKYVYDAEETDYSTSVKGSRKAFNISVKSPLRIYSNLDLAGDSKQLQGDSECLTLLAGMARTDSDFFALNSLVAENRANLEELCAEEILRLEKWAVEFLGGAYQPPDLTNTSIILTPHTFLCKSVLFDDHFLVNSWAFADDLFVQELKSSINKKYTRYGFVYILRNLGAYENVFEEPPKKYIFEEGQVIVLDKAGIIADLEYMPEDPITYIGGGHPAINNAIHYLLHLDIKADNHDYLRMVYDYVQSDNEQPEREWFIEILRGLPNE